MKISEIKEGYNILPEFKGFKLKHTFRDNKVLESINITLVKPDSEGLLSFCLNLYDFNKDNMFNCFMCRTSYYQNSVYEKRFSIESELSEVIDWIKSVFQNFCNVIKNVLDE